MSPIRVELFLRSLETRMISFVSKKMGSLGMVILGLALAYFLWASPEFFEQIRESKKNGGFHVLRLLKYSLPFLLVASLPVAFLRENARKLIFPTSVLAWCLSVYFFFSHVPALTLGLIYLIYPLGVIIGSQVISSQTSKRIFFLYGCLFLGFFAYITWSLFHFSPNRLFVFWSLKIQYLLLEVFLIRFFFSQKNHPKDLLLSPTFAARSLVLPETGGYQEDFTKRRILWWQGFYGISLGLMLAIARLQFEDLIIGTTPSLYYPGKYILAVLGIMSFLNILSGVARLYGFWLVDATNFVWLSRSPAEYWRRGSVYSYLLIQKYVYLPLLSRLRSPRLSRFLAFFIFINLKIGVVNYLSLSAHWFGFTMFSRHHLNYQREYFSIIHWVLWFLVLEISYSWFLRTRIKEKAWKAWLSVLATHATMASLYYLTYILYHIGVQYGLR